MKNKMLAMAMLPVAFSIGMQAAHAAGEEIQAPVVNPGDTWNYSVIDLWKNSESNAYEVTASAGDDAHFIFNIKNRSNSKGILRSTKELNVCRSLKETSGEVCSSHFNFPLKIGQKTNFSDLPNASGTSKWAEDCQVAENEKITVPAGTYDTIRVECSGFWSRTATGASQAVQGRMKELFWYSPDVNRWVRYEIYDWDIGGAAKSQPLNRYRHELVSYTKAQS